MKKSLLTFILLISFAALFAQSKSLPLIDIEDMDGNPVNVKSFKNDGGPTVIVFWATWSRSSINELNALHKVYDDWKAETGVRIIAISIDEARMTPRIKNLAKVHDWKFDMYEDVKGLLTRALDAHTFPKTLILDNKLNITYEKDDFTAGDEANLLEEIKKANHK